MDKAIWRGKEIYALHIIESQQKNPRAIDLETDIRDSYEKGDLICSDPDCKARVFYRHGRNRIPHFAHEAGTKCEYSEYESRISRNLRIEKIKLFEILKKANPHIQMDAKITKAFFVPIFNRVDNQNRFAVEIIDSNSGIQVITKLREKYADSGIKYQIVVFDEKGATNSRYDTHFIERYNLSKGEEQDLIIMNKAGVVFQHREDSVTILDDELEAYRYLLEKDFPKIFSILGKVSDLVIECGRITLPAFSMKFEEYIRRRKEHFNKFKQRLKQEKSNRVLADRKNHTFNEANKPQKAISHDISPSKMQKSLPKYSLEKKPDSVSGNLSPDVIRMLESKYAKATDSKGNWFRRCKVCKKVAHNDAFSDYFDEEHVNKGICKECSSRANRN